MPSLGELLVRTAPVTTQQGNPTLSTQTNPLYNLALVDRLRTKDTGIFAQAPMGFVHEKVVDQHAKALGLNPSWNDVVQFVNEVSLLTPNPLADSWHVVETAMESPFNVVYGLLGGDNRYGERPLMHSDLDALATILQQAQ